MSDLDARLLAAHARDDKAALIALYAEAGAGAPEDVARAFYLTHAFVFALEAGDVRAQELRQSLKDMGRI